MEKKKQLFLFDFIGSVTSSLQNGPRCKKKSYETFFMLTSTEPEISTAHKSLKC